jgi:hypothetical protein
MADRSDDAVLAKHIWNFPPGSVLSVTALFDANQLVGWLPEDGDGATGIPLRIHERRPIDAMAAHPFDGKRGRGFYNLDRFSFALLGEPCDEEISAVE